MPASLRLSAVRPRPGAKFSMPEKDQFATFHGATGRYLTFLSESAPIYGFEYGEADTPAWWRAVRALNRWNGEQGGA